MRLRTLIVLFVTGLVAVGVARRRQPELEHAR